jgi:hypothetical protein
VSQGTQVLLGAAAGIRVYVILLICQESRNDCKNGDEPINFIVRVIASALFNFDFKEHFSSWYFIFR